MNFSGLVSLLATVVSRLTAHDHSGCQLTRNWWCRKPTYQNMFSSCSSGPFCPENLNFSQVLIWDCNIWNMFDRWEEFFSGTPKSTWITIKMCV